MREETVSVVAPVYNNAATLPALTARIRAAFPATPLEIILVDDRSTDRSREVMRTLGVRVIMHERNQGQNAAVLTGLRAATGAVCCALDADLEDPPEALPALVRALDPRDIDAVPLDHARAVPDAATARVPVFRNRRPHPRSSDRLRGVRRLSAGGDRCTRRTDDATDDQPRKPFGRGGAIAVAALSPRGARAAIGGRAPADGGTGQRAPARAVINR
jgi:glycosyltransferase involved in cell wall biosynthesis